MLGGGDRDGEGAFQSGGGGRGFVSANHKNKEEEVINRHCNDCLERKSEERRLVERRDREREEEERKVNAKVGSEKS